VIVLYTHVVSELVRPAPNLAVLAWVDAKPAVVYAGLVSAREQLGQPLAMIDA
jgi:predicted nucleic acid-binding protein